MDARQKYDTIREATSQNHVTKYNGSAREYNIRLQFLPHNIIHMVIGEHAKRMRKRKWKIKCKLAEIKIMRKNILFIY